MWLLLSDKIGVSAWAIGLNKESWEMVSKDSACPEGNFMINQCLRFLLSITQK